MRLLAALASVALILAGCSSDSSDSLGSSHGDQDPCLLSVPRTGSCDWRDAPNPRFHCIDYGGGEPPSCQEEGQDLVSKDACERAYAVGCCVGHDKENPELDRVEMFYSSNDPDIAACKSDPGSTYHDLTTTK